MIIPLDHALFSGEAGSLNDEIYYQNPDGDLCVAQEVSSYEPAEKSILVEQSMHFVVAHVIGNTDLDNPTKSRKIILMPPEPTSLIQ